MGGLLQTHFRDEIREEISKAKECLLESLGKEITNQPLLSATRLLASSVAASERGLVWALTSQASLSLGIS